MEEQKKPEARSKEVRSALFYNPKNGYDRVTEADRRQITRIGEAYKTYLNHGKTERDAARYTAELAEARGFVPYHRGMNLKTGDRVYTINRSKSVILAVIGRRSLAEGVGIAAAHIDVPRLDLKPMPVYEEKKELCFLKTHYYGGIKKYQWVTIPLELRGVVALRDGSVVDISLGGKPNDPLFTITDLLPHLAKDQSEKKLGEGISGESLNLLAGSIPSATEPEGGDRVKLAILELLYEQYGITEEDFLSAELSVVPAFDARDVGFDRSLVGGYGHDDRVCAYAGLAAILDLGIPERTAVCVLADKEEIGSVGSTGMQSAFFDTFMNDLCEGQSVPLRVCFESSSCLSADVSNAFDPNYADVSEPRNSAYINYGMSVVKYVGARGKSGSNDANAEFLGRLRCVLDGASVIWQSCELGKVDQGGGGTVAGYMANRNIETVDVGVPVLSMHSPYEVISKLDLYMTVKGIAAFYTAKDE